MSRQPTWDLACKLQGEMFDAVAKAGGLSVQLAYFRGLGEFKASAFVARTDALKKLMTAIDCRGGHTQIGKVLAHALAESKRGKVGALVYIGDAMEERADDLVPRPASSDCAACRCSRSRRERTALPSAPSRRLRAYRKAHGSASTAIRQQRWRGFSPLSRCLRRVAQGAGSARPRRGPAADFVTARRTQMIDILAGFVVAALLLVAFLRSSPASVASAIRMLGPVLLGIAGFAVVGIGKAAAGSFMVAAGTGLVRRIASVAQDAEARHQRRSMVRTAALEMELDHETGAAGRGGACRPQRGQRCSARWARPSWSRSIASSAATSRAASC